MKRRVYLITIAGTSALSSGCLSSGRIRGGSPNCTEIYRDSTINEIDESHKNSALDMAGQITEKRPDDRWVLISDGTGVAKVDVAGTKLGTQLMNQPESKCIEYNAIISDVVSGGSADVTMYYGELVNSG